MKQRHRKYGCRCKRKQTVPQNEHRNDIGLAGANCGEAECHRGGKAKQAERLERICRRQPLGRRAAVSAVGRQIIRNDVHIHIGGQRRQLLHQRGPRQNAASVVGTSNDDFGNAAGACVFGNLRGDVLAVNRGDACAELFGQAQVAAQAGEALAIQLPGAGTSTNRAVKRP